MTPYQSGRTRAEFGPRALLLAFIAWQARRFPGHVAGRDTDLYGDFE